jgi:signal transduction histidine kinase
VLEPWLATGSADLPRVLHDEDGGPAASTALFQLGTQDEVGTLVVGSHRTDFPTEIERLLIQVAANEATVGLQEARHVRQQQRATDELERRVAARTSELASVNQELRTEVLARKRAMDLNRHLAGRLIASQEEERQRIARELHDDLGQNIALLNIEIAQVAARIDADEIRSRLQTIAGRAGEIAGDLHNLSHALHPSKLQTLGLQTAIHALCRDVSLQGEVRVAFTPGPLPQSVDPAVSLCLYRIAQEALRNVARHSGARDAQMRLTQDGGHLVLQVADAGAGFDPNAQHAGLGLVSMRERVAFLNGRLSIEAAAGGGTRIEVRVPLAPTNRESAVPVA